MTYLVSSGQKSVWLDSCPRSEASNDPGERKASWELKRRKEVRQEEAFPVLFAENPETRTRAVGRLCRRAVTGSKARGCLLQERQAAAKSTSIKGEKTMKGIPVFLAVVALVASVTVAPVLAGPNTQSKSAAAAKLRIDLNTATAEELAELPGIGDKVAARIVAFREENGGFKKIEEIMNVKGIGEKTFTKLRGNLYVDTSKKGSNKKK
jgi:competence protein ComEA